MPPPEPPPPPPTPASNGTPEPLLHAAKPNAIKEIALNRITDEKRNFMLLNLSILLRKNNFPMRIINCVPPRKECLPLFTINVAILAA